MTRRIKAYTLIELLAVITIIAVMLLLVITNLDNLVPGYRLRAGARQIGSLLKLARNYASAEGKTVYVVYDIKNSRAGIQTAVEVELSAQLPITHGLSMPMVWEENISETLPEGVTIDAVIVATEEPRSDETVTVAISPFGTSIGHVVHLKGAEAEYFSIQMNPLTGVVTYSKGQAELILPTEEAEE